MNPMMEEFDQVISFDPRIGEILLEQMRSAILQAVENLMSEDEVYRDLEKICVDNEHDNSRTKVKLTHDLLLYFTQRIKEDFTSLKAYSNLEAALQKNEEAIRKHVKIQQEMHLRIEFLEEELQQQAQQIAALHSDTTLQMSVYARNLELKDFKIGLLQKDKRKFIKEKQSLGVKYSDKQAQSKQDFFFSEKKDLLKFKQRRMSNSFGMLDKTEQSIGRFDGRNLQFKSPEMVRT